MKCPSCGFDTPETQDWCDFCKEPFRKRKSKYAEEPPVVVDPSQVRPASRVDVSPEILAQLQRIKEEEKKKRPAESSGGIPEEFAHLDSGGKVGGVPPIARKLAWIFLAVCALWASLATLWMIDRANRIQTGTGRLPAALLWGEPKVNA